MKSLERAEARLLDARFDWAAIDPERIRGNVHVLERIREACLIESYFSVYAGRLLTLFRRDLQAVSALIIEAFEAYTHYAALRRYLEIVRYRPIGDEEVLRLRDEDRSHEYNDEIRELVNFGMTEAFAAQFFRDLASLAGEPVLQAMLEQFAPEETAHAEFAFDLLAERLRRRPGDAARVLRCAREFRHVGAYVMPSVSTAADDNLKTIHAVNQRLERLTGRRLSDYVFDEG